MKQGDIPGIQPEEAIGASILPGPTTKEEEDGGEDDLGETGGPEEEERTEHRRIGFLGENGELLRERRADEGNGEQIIEHTSKERQRRRDWVGCLTQVTCNGSSICGAVLETLHDSRTYCRGDCGIGGGL
jgi:hypothetical protein